MKKILPILLWFLWIGSANAQYQGPVTANEILPVTINQLPLTNVRSGSVRTVTNGADATDCSVGGGTDVHICMWDGTAWVPVGSGSGGVFVEAQTQQDTHVLGNYVVANSAATAMEIRSDSAGTNKVQVYWDATVGLVTVYTPSVDNRFMCYTDKVCYVWDQEADAAILTINPDAGGTGIGTIRVGSGYELYDTYTRINICQGVLGQVCHLYTDKSAAFVEAQGGNGPFYFDLSRFRQFRISAHMAAAAVTADIEIQCDADSAFGSAAVLGQLVNPVVNGNVGSWTNIPANECATADGIWIRFGMINGNTTEDPSIRNAGLELK